MSALSGVQGAINQAIGSFNLPGALSTTVAPSPGATTTAVNGLLVVNGAVQGLVRSLRVDEGFGVQGPKAIGSAVRVALVPGVYEGSGSIERSFLFGQSLTQAFGNLLLPIIGKNLASNDFTQSYFNLITLDNQGNPRKTYHDCMFSSISEAISIDQVVIVQDAQLMIRWAL